MNAICGDRVGRLVWPVKEQQGIQVVRFLDGRQLGGEVGHDGVAGVEAALRTQAGKQHGGVGSVLCHHADAQAEGIALLDRGIELQDVGDRQRDAARADQRVGEVEKAIQARLRIIIAAGGKRQAGTADVQGREEVVGVRAAARTHALAERRVEHQRRADRQQHRPHHHQAYHGHRPAKRPGGVAVDRQPARDVPEHPPGHARYPQADDAGAGAAGAVRADLGVQDGEENVDEDAKDQQCASQLLEPFRHRFLH